LKAPMFFLSMSAFTDNNFYLSAFRTGRVTISIVPQRNDPNIYLFCVGFLC